MWRSRAVKRRHDERKRVLHKQSDITVQLDVLEDYPSKIGGTRDPLSFE